MDGGAADGAAGVTGGRRRVRCRPVVDGRLGRGCRRTAKTRGRRTGRALHRLVAGPQPLVRSNRKTKARGTSWAHNLLKKHQRGKEGASTVAASPLSLTSAAIGESKVLGVFRPPSLPRPRVGYMLPPGRGPAPQSISPSRGQPPPDESTSTYTGPPRPPLPLGRSPRATPARYLPSQFTPTAATPLATAPGVGGGGGSGRVPTAALAPRPPPAPWGATLASIQPSVPRRQGAPPQDPELHPPEPRQLPAAAAGVSPSPQPRPTPRGGSPSPAACGGMPDTHGRAGLRPVGCRPLHRGPRSLPTQSGASTVA